jgi:hypothetical protein
MPNTVKVFRTTAPSADTDTDPTWPVRFAAAAVRVYGDRF